MSTIFHFFIPVQFFSVVCLEIGQHERCPLSASPSIYGYTFVYLHKIFAISYHLFDASPATRVNSRHADKKIYVMLDRKWNIFYLYFQFLKCLLHWKKMVGYIFKDIICYIYINSKNYIHWEHNKNVCKKNLTERYRMLQLSAYLIQRKMQ